MKRGQPPSLATWMLEHSTPSGVDEALSGDLLEEYCGGRSDGWYWRQVVAACVVSWLWTLRSRMHLLVFALLWSMLAPAWKVLCDRIQDSQSLDRAWEMVGGLWVLPAFAVWAVLHSTFLWAGMLVYILCHACLGKAFRGKHVRRAFLLAPLVFSPIYGVTFVLANLYWYSLFANAKLAATPLGQIGDLRMLADVMRIPYFIALLCPLWAAIPRSTRNSQPLFVQSAPTESNALSLASTLHPFTLRRFFGLLVGAGLINAMLIAFLLCRLPGSHAPDFASLLIRAIGYVAVGALAGVGGTWLYWKSPSSPFREHPPLPFTLFALVSAAGWVWVPSMVIFSEQISAATAFIAMIGAFVLASGMRSATYFVFAPAKRSLSFPEQGGAELFAESLHRSPTELHGYVIAIGLYTAGAALFTRSNYAAAAFLALSTYLFAWKQTFVRIHDSDNKTQYKRAAIRLALVVLPAILVTVWALLDGVAHRNHEEISPAPAAGNEQPHPNAKFASSAIGSDGYESIILLPKPEKKQIVAPLPARTSLLAPGTSRPLVIRFNGAYWYFQSPGKRPGPEAHRAHDNPLAVNIESSNFIPLITEAHQSLGSAIPLARCREIQVVIENRDRSPGAVALAVLLTDSVSPAKPALYLGQQPVSQAGKDRLAPRSAPVSEVLRFSIPGKAKIRRFDEITVMLIPDVEHSFVGPKIAIQQFNLLPR